MSQSYLEFRESLKNKAKGKKSRSKKDKVKKIKTKGKSKAKKVAEKTLKENLKEEHQISLSVDGSTLYVAGGIIELDESWGKFAGKYVIDKVTHSISGDYVCDLECMRIGAREKATQRAKEETVKKEASKKNGNNKARGNK